MISIPAWFYRFLIAIAIILILFIFIILSLAFFKKSKKYDFMPGILEKAEFGSYSWLARTPDLKKWICGKWYFSKH